MKMHCTLQIVVILNKAAHKCRPLLWVAPPTPVSVMLCPKAVSGSVKKGLLFLAVLLNNQADFFYF